MGSEFETMINSNGGHVGEVEKDGIQKISVSELQHGTNMKSESFVVDMERFSLLKDINSSRFTLQRNLSRKGSGRSRGAEKKSDQAVGNERDVTMLTTLHNDAATLHGGTSTPEKPTVLTLGPVNHSIVPQGHHQITVTNGGLSSPLSVRQSSFRRSQHSWTIISPRRILLFFATLSSMGTILLIYFTLSISKLNDESTNLE